MSRQCLDEKKKKKKDNKMEVGKITDCVGNFQTIFLGNICPLALCLKKIKVPLNQDFTEL